MSEMQSAARELVSWFMSGNGVRVDVRHTARINGDQIMLDAERLKSALENEDGSA